MPKLDVSFPILIPEDCTHNDQVLGFYSHSNGKFFHFSSRTQLPSDTVRVRASDITDDAIYPFTQHTFYQKNVLKRVSITNRASRRTLPTFSQDEHRRGLLSAYDDAYVQCQLDAWGKFHQLETDNNNLNQDDADTVDAANTAEAAEVSEQTDDQLQHFEKEGQNELTKFMRDEVMQKITSTIQFLRKMWIDAFKRNMKTGLGSAISGVDMNQQQILGNVMKKLDSGVMAAVELQKRASSKKQELRDRYESAKTDLEGRVNDAKTDAKTSNIAKIVKANYKGGWLEKGWNATKKIVGKPLGILKSGMSWLFSKAKAAIGRLYKWYSKSPNAMLAGSIGFALLQDVTCKMAGQESMVCGPLSDVLKSVGTANMTTFEFTIPPEAAAMFDVAGGGGVATLIAKTGVKVPAGMIINGFEKLYSGGQNLFFDMKTVKDATLKKELGWTNRGFGALWKGSRGGGNIEKGSFLDELKDQTHGCIIWSDTTLSNMTAEEILQIIEDPVGYQRHFGDMLGRVAKNAVLGPFRLISFATGAMATTVKNWWRGREEKEAAAENERQIKAFLEIMGVRVCDESMSELANSGAFQEWKRKDHIHEKIEMLRDYVEDNTDDSNNFGPILTENPNTMLGRIMDCTPPFKPLKSGKGCTKVLQKAGIAKTEDVKANKAAFEAWHAKLYAKAASPPKIPDLEDANPNYKKVASKVRTVAECLRKEAPAASDVAMPPPKSGMQKVTDFFETVFEKMKAMMKPVVDRLNGWMEKIMKIVPYIGKLLGMAVTMLMTSVENAGKYATNEMWLGMKAINTTKLLYSVFGNVITWITKCLGPLIDQKMRDIAEWKLFEKTLVAETPKAPETPETPETPKAPEIPETSGIYDNLFPKAPETSGIYDAPRSKFDTYFSSKKQKEMRQFIETNVSKMKL